MKRHDLQSIDFEIPAEQAFAYISDKTRYPEWTNAFASVEGDRALMRTPQGEVEIELVTLTDARWGTIDSRMTFPDGNVAWAYSRVLPLGPERCVYEFLLPAPPGPLEELEGDLREQSKTLARELRTLKGILENEPVRI